MQSFQYLSSVRCTRGRSIGSPPPITLFFVRLCSEPSPQRRTRRHLYLGLLNNTTRRTSQNPISPKPFLLHCPSTSPQMATPYTSWKYRLINKATHDERSTPRITAQQALTEYDRIHDKLIERYWMVSHDVVLFLIDERFWNDNCMYMSISIRYSSLRERDY